MTTRRRARRPGSTNLRPSTRPAGDTAADPAGQFGHGRGGATALGGSRDLDRAGGSTDGSGGGERFDGHFDRAGIDGTGFDGTGFDGTGFDGTLDTADATELDRAGDVADDEWDQLAENPREIALAGAVRLAPGGRRTVALAGAAPRRVGSPSPQRARPASPQRVSPARTRTAPGPTGTWLSRRPEGWPLQALLVGFPLWWALGLGIFIFPILAVPMLWDLRKKAPIRFPPLFWMWAMYLLWQVLSLVMFNANPPGTHATGSGGRLASIFFNLVQLGGVTVTLLYVGNLSMRNVSQKAIARWMGSFFITVAAGGFLGVLAPRFQFRSPMELLLPARVANDPYIRSLIHPISAQLQNVIGTEAGRPAAPFGFTNSWGNAIGILIIWFVVGWILPARPWLRVVYGLGVAASFVPIVLSLNRGLWIGLIFLVGFVAFLHLLRGRVALLAAAVGVVAVLGLAVVFTPLNGVIAARLQNGDSNSIRSFVAAQSINAVKHSPVLGYGGTRHTDGSATSIAVGKSANCAACGDVATGSTGSLWAIMFNSGLGGTVLYFGFFAAAFWVYRRERSPIGDAALATIAIGFVFMFFYNALPAAPTLTMIAVAILWRSRDQQLGIADRPIGLGLPDGR